MTLTAPVVGSTTIGIPAEVPGVISSTLVTRFVFVGVTQVPSPLKNVVLEPFGGT